MNERHGDAWVCTDCYFAHHYGARQEEFEAEDLGFDIEDGNALVVQLWFAGEDDEPVGGWYMIRDNHDLSHNLEPLGKLEGFEVADNTCSDHRSLPCEHCGGDDWENGITDFTWSSCDGCGSHLGGSRYRLSLWKENA